MLRLIFLRHGETDTSTDSDLIEGRSATPLNAVGERQASAAAEAIAGAHLLALVYSSPLRRACRTAELLAKACRASHAVHGGLQERDFGSLEGWRWNDVEPEVGAEVQARDLGVTYDYRPWGGESVEDVKRRLGRLIAYLKGSHDGETVACVTHGGVLRLMGFEVPWRASAEWFKIEL